MSVPSNSPLVLRLLQALGAPKRVRSFTLRGSVGQPLVLELEYHPDPLAVDEAEELVTLAASFELTPR